jgi:hypothetical protein
MPLEGTGKIGTVDPLSIIRDSNEGQPSLLHIDRDMQAPCIETVFQAFFGDGGRAFDDLAGCDTADYVVREDMDLGGTTGGGHAARLQGMPGTRWPLRAISMDVRSSNFGQLILGQLRLVRRGKLFDDPFEILL